MTHILNRTRQKSENQAMLPEKEPDEDEPALQTGFTPIEDLDREARSVAESSARYFYTYEEEDAHYRGLYAQSIQSSIPAGNPGNN